jgi:hypothetical protein
MKPTTEKLALAGTWAVGAGSGAAIGVVSRLLPPQALKATRIASPANTILLLWCFMHGS